MCKSINTLGVFDVAPRQICKHLVLTCRQEAASVTGGRLLHKFDVPVQQNSLFFEMGFYIVDVTFWAFWELAGAF